MNMDETSVEECQFENENPLENPLLSNHAQIDWQDGKYPIEPDSIIVQCIKRLYSIAPLFAMAFSSINQVFTIGKSVASQSSPDQDYNSEVIVISNGQQDYFTCKNGNADAVVTYCPYGPSPAFQGILAMWVVYFGVFMVARLWATIHYSTNDLRFYIAVDKYNGNLFNKFLVYLGFALTILSICIGLYYLTPQTEWNSTVDTNSVTDMAVFMGINFIALHGLLKMVTGSTDHSSSITMEEFPVEILLSHCRGIYTVFRSVDSVIKPILVSYMLFLINKDESLLRAYGNPPQLKHAMKKLYKPVVKK